jgi:hypothetical protein
MARGDLHKLISEAREALEGSNKLKKVREEYNKEPHVYVVNSETIKNQILIQIGRKKNSITSKQDEMLDKIVKEYTKALYGTFNNRKSKTFKYKVHGNENNFYVLVTTLDSSTSSDIYKQIAKVREDRLSTLKNKVVKLFPKVTKEDTRHLLEIGHHQGHSISEVRIQKALSSLRSFGPIREEPIADSVLNLVLTSTEPSSGSTLKTYAMYVEDEAIKSNTGVRSAGENKLLVTARKVLDDFLSKNDWGNQAGSNSPVDIVITEILKASKKAGAKTRTKLVKRGSAKTTVKTSAVMKNKTKKPIAVKDPGVGVIDVPDGSIQRNWNSLLPLINSKLTPRVIANMRSPSLVNRTGRFAQSAEVVRIEETREGSPSFVFNYERDPYDVFDRTLGRAPWNTPERDPRALVDKSVREIVREMAIGRFYTRRA